MTAHLGETNSLGAGAHRPGVDYSAPPSMFALMKEEIDNRSGLAGKRVIFIVLPGDVKQQVRPGGIPVPLGIASGSQGPHPHSLPDTAQEM